MNTISSKTTLATNYRGFGLLYKTEDGLSCPKYRLAYHVLGHSVLGQPFHGLGCLEPSCLWAKLSWTGFITPDDQRSALIA